MAAIDLPPAPAARLKTFWAFLASFLPASLFVHIFELGRTRALDPVFSGTFGESIRIVLLPTALTMLAAAFSFGLGLIAGTPFEEGGGDDPRPRPVAACVGAIAIAAGLGCLRRLLIDGRGVARPAASIAVLVYLLLAPLLLGSWLARSAPRPARGGGRRP